ncbi:MAG: sarcosine oxidase subunit alpha family protein [Stenotrophobium sp.]
MTQSLRSTVGGNIDRNQPLHFRFDGREYTGFSGDTLASALLANGVRVTGRSFKYHRPRGLMAAGFEEANTIVQLGRGSRTEPNLRATQIELTEGLDAKAVNCWPSARYDVFGLFRLFKPFWPAGFYYKTFMAPSWRFWEPAIRHGAGLGVSPSDPDPDVYEKQHASVDVIVVGAGPSGLAAAIGAGELGAAVMLIDDKPELGGSCLYEFGTIEGDSTVVWKERQLEILASMPNVRILTRTTAFGYYDHNHLLANELLPANGKGACQRLWKIRGRQIVLATGALERPLVFPNNDRPGVMLAGAARQYLHRFGVLPGKRVVIATNNDSAYDVAVELRRIGIDVALIADTRDVEESSAISRVRAMGIEVASRTTPTDTTGTNGLRSVELHRVDAEGRAQPRTVRWLAADSLLVSGGWSPTVHLFSQSGGSLRFDDDMKAFVPDRYAQPGALVGAAAGIGDMDAAIAAARTAGVHAAGGSTATPAVVSHPVNAGQTFWSVDVTTLGRNSAKAWVDLASDSTESDLRLAAKENFISVELFKRYTTTGMMTDQGKTSNVNAIGILGGVLAKKPGDVGTTRFRPPFNPITFGSIAGRNVDKFYRPLRRVPAHDSHVSLGAKMEDYGAWLRPAYYPQSGEDEHVALQREVLAIRERGGFLDYSPLGKILVSGPDAATFLQRVYVNNVQNMKVGQCRYGLMLGEDGIVKDDGILTRWSDESFVVGTTSGMADRIVDWLEEWLQCEWVDLDVTVESVSTQWATIMVAGPKSREILTRLGSDISLSSEGLPHMWACEGSVAGIPVRIARVSFTGELGFEISMPWSYGRSLWDALVSMGREFGMIPFGLESLLLMRVEKGFLHVGSDTDGLTLPQDVGFGPAIEKKKEDFIGRRSTMTPNARRPDRRQLVGLEPVDGRTFLSLGAHIVGQDFKAPPVRSQGWVTSSVNSPTLARPVAMGLVERGLERMGEQVQIYDGGQLIAARITRNAFYDPQGERLRM